MKINIIGGSGQMGRTHKPIFEAAGHEVIISGRNSTPNMEEGAKNSDLTIISVPIPATEEIIKKVAPYCTAIMDFTSLKKFPVEAMLKYSSPNCEVGGLHPLYGESPSIKGMTIIYCPTKKSGKKCQEVINALKSAGARIITATPEEHDFKIALTQNARIKLLEAYALLIKDSKLTIEESYKFSPPPTKKILDLIARQVNENNNEMYKAMQDYNPLDKEIRDNLIEILKNPKNAPERIRELFDNQLESAQKRAKKLLSSEE